MLSSMVTVDSQVEIFPFGSSTVSVTMFTPTFEQSKVAGVTIVGVTVPQASELPLFTIFGVIVAFPEASN